MSLNRPARSLAADSVVAQPEDGLICLHAAFCNMALPMCATREGWQRDIGTGSIRIEPGVSDVALPSVRILRLSLMHICDAAFRANSQVVELGKDEGLLAAALGIDPETEDLTNQWQRLQAARILMSWDGGPEISMFDARSRRRAGDLEWRSGVRLSSKFLASLVNHAIPLDRRVVSELSAAPAALDAYAWIRVSLQHAIADQIVTATWGDLQRRFGTASQEALEFRSTFEAALRLVFEADSSVDVAVEDEGVSVRRAQPAVSEIAAGGTTPMPPGVDVVDIDTVKLPEPAAVLPSTMPVVAAAEVPRPSAPRQRNSASQHAPRKQQPTLPATADRIMRNDISLPGNLTGLAVVIWLRRGHGDENVLVGVTPSPRFEAERLTVLAVEPMVLQVSGGLHEADFERVSAWVMSNRDVIDEFWEGRITSFAEINRRVRKAPAPGWR